MTFRALAVIALGCACSFDAPDAGVVPGDDRDGPPIDPIVDAGAVGDAGASPGDAAGPDAASCRDGYTATPGLGCHRVVTASRGWVGAEEDCELDGGHLVVVGSEGENELVTGLLAGSRGWIGASDRRVRGFVWVTREASGYAAWADGEPNDGGPLSLFGEDCVEITDRGEWNDEGCLDGRPSVCEHDGRRADPSTY